MPTVFEKVELLFGQLMSAPLEAFPKLRKPMPAPTEQGVYVIINHKSEVVHVGRTISGAKGLYQRLCNHLSNNSSFSREFLQGRGAKLRKDYCFRYVVVPNDKLRAYLEAYAIGHLCPKHIGTGRKK